MAEAKQFQTKRIMLPMEPGQTGRINILLSMQNLHGCTNESAANLWR